jgi:hypothetical protein
MAQKSNESIDNDLKYQVLKAKMEADQIKKGYWFTPTPIDPTHTTRIKEIRMDGLHESEKIDVDIQDNGYVIKDGFGREIKRIPPTDSKVETGYITRDEKNGVGYLHYPDGNVQPFKIRDATTKKIKKEAAINELKDLANEYGKEDPRIKKEKVDDQQVDVEKLLSALDQIADKLLDYKYIGANYILDLKEFITSDCRIIKSTHLDKEYINRTIYRVDRLINDAEDDLDASELMVLYFGIYLARIKNKEIRSVKISRRI